MRILSQSSSVFGNFSTVPCSVDSLLTASKILSEAGSSMSRISSLTETTGLRSPQSADAGGGAGAGFDDEQPCVHTAMTNSPAQNARRGKLRIERVTI